MLQLTGEDITLLRLNDASISYINMLLKHSYQKWQASMLQEQEIENII